MAPSTETVSHILRDASIDYELENVEVKVEDISYVKPENGHAHGYLYLSSLDLFWAQFHYNRRLIFYRIQGLHDQELMIKKLKSSLAQVLAHFYPLAGRLVEDHQEDGSTRYVIDCESLHGVEFVVASVDLSLHPLQQSNFHPLSFFDKLARFSNTANCGVTDLPLLSIQVTKFTCGGISLGYAHSHVVADGHSMWHFMNSWAEVARGVPITLLPTHDRTYFKVDEPSEDITQHMNLPPAWEGATETGSRKAKGLMTQKLFHVSNDMLNCLKTEAGVHPDMPRPFSSYEVICAHWWRHVMKARDLEDDAIVRFAVLADMRSRVNPPLSSSYFGNAVMFAFASSTYGEVKQEKLGSIAYRIHLTSKDCNEARLWGKIHWLELHGTVFGSRLQWVGSTMNMASSPRFNVYGVDFGWGQPAAARTVRVVGDGETVVFRGADGGLDMCMSLGELAMERLVEDSEFILT